jgi:hypothetical protein
MKMTEGQAFELWHLLRNTSPLKEALTVLYGFDISAMQPDEGAVGLLEDWAQALKGTVWDTLEKRPAETHSG